MNDASQPAPTPAPALVYRSRPGLPGLVLRNLFLNLVTFWIYRFWAKTRWRQHLWSNVSILGDPVEYTGTGPEMFKGFLVALAFLAPFFIVFGAWEAMVAGSGVGTAIEQIAYFAALYALFVAASFYARRYRLSRTRWRGTALVLDAKFGDYLKFYLRTQALNALTLFTMTPRASMEIEAWLVSRTRLGAVAFDCAPDWRALMGKWLLFQASAVAMLIFGWGWLAANSDGEVPDIGLPPTHGGILFLLILFVPCAYLAYRVASFRAVANAATLNGAAFASTARPVTITFYLFLGLVAFVAIVGLVAAILESGVGIPGALAGAVAGILAFALIRDAWVAPWIVDHIVNSVTISNPEALAAIAAGTEDALTRGEGLADSFDVGIG
jgi:uncharacterized membrane protein YjgN (DUF898 family)